MTSFQSGCKLSLGLIFLQPPCLNGFLMILDCNGELFFATHTIETFLGFHQVSLEQSISSPPCAYIIHYLAVRCHSPISLRTGPLRRQRGVAASADLELVLDPGGGLVRGDVARPASARKQQSFGAVIHRSIPVSSRQHVRIPPFGYPGPDQGASWSEQKVR